ncbi:MAG: DUF2339 domain-containing protein [Actinomycetota bacterium]|nr:DUF2339 domain-containing protein [Actinomycetota bacterium]
MMREGGQNLEERVRRLEADVEGHERELECLRLSLALSMEKTVPDRVEPAPGAAVAPRGYTVAVPEPDAPERTLPEDLWETGTNRSSEGAWRGLELPFELANLRRWEWWMNKVGIALFLMGVVFLFKFSWDRGWLQVLLTPVVRAGLGIFLGSALVWVGLRVYADRRAFAQVVLGGGIGTYYITGFAAFQMLGVFSYPVAFTFMAAVTLLAFALALRQDGAVLAVIGVSGGLATPFLLYDGEGTLGGLVLYAGLVLTGAMGIYLLKGWRSLLLVAFVGYWAVMFTGYAGVVAVYTLPVADGVALQVGALFGWISLWLVPAAREALRSTNPGRWRAPEIGAAMRVVLVGNERFLKDGTPAHVLSFFSPLITLWMTQLFWSPGQTALGLVALGIAASHGIAWVGFRRVERGGSVSYTQAIVALLFATLSLVFLLEGETLLLVLAAEAAALHLVARRLSDRVVSLIAHALFAVVGAWMFSLIAAGTLDHLFGTYTVIPFFNAHALVGLAVVALAFASSTAIGRPEVRRVYRVFGHAAVAGLLLRELVPLADGAYALVALALYAAGLHLLSRRRPEWGTTGGAHALAAFVGLWLAGRLATGMVFPGDIGMAVFNLPGLADLAVVSLILACSWTAGGRKTVLVYRVAAHAALLAWFWREFGMLPGSPDAYVTLAWGLCGAAMFVAGLRRDHAYLIKGGVATLFLVVAKLFLWDLAGLDPLWRVLLFLGFGGLFLILSYHLRNLWNPRDGGDGADPHVPNGHLSRRPS